MIKLYGIKSCDSVRKARKFFTEHAIDFEMIDFDVSPATAETIDHWLQSTDVEKLFNARSTTCRTLGLKTKELNAEQKREWLCRENRLIKRPVVVHHDQVLIGFDLKLYEGVFLS